MQKRLSPVRAAIDIGSNTIHLVVARSTYSTPGDLDIIEDQVEIVRIGESVTASGIISPEKREHTLALLRQYKALAEEHGAEKILVVATEAIRQARNSAEFLDDIYRETGLLVSLISGSVEAALTFSGATYEAIKAGNVPTYLGVMDLGGGSTELVIARHMRMAWSTSLPIGSGWLHDRYLRGNPPSLDELAVAQTFLRTYLQGMPGLPVKYRPTKMIVTGGSANSLLYLTQLAFRREPSDMRLTHDDLVRCEGLLGALTAEEIAHRYGQPLSRARILPAGVLIIREMMSRLHLSEIIVSPHGIREGTLLAYAQYGEHWLKRLEQPGQVGQVDGKAGTSQTGDGDSTGEDGAKGTQEEPFADAGHRILLERVSKLFEWYDAVLKHEDEDGEAVHKMRVATRRLRAALDAYENCCQPRPFKKVYRQVKEIADVLGDARDADVMLQGLREKFEQTPSTEQPVTQWLIDRLDVYRQQKQHDLRQFFEEMCDIENLQHRIQSCISKNGAAHHG